MRVNLLANLALLFSTCLVHSGWGGCSEEEEDEEDDRVLSRGSNTEIKKSSMKIQLSLTNITLNFKDNTGTDRKKHDNNISTWKYFTNDTQRVDRKQHDNNISMWKYFTNDTQVQIENMTILECENISQMIHEYR